MEYNAEELKTLDLLKRTDFSHLSKNEIVSFVSKIGEMRPEVAKEVIAQFPELASMMKTALAEYKGMLEEAIKSDDKSIENYYNINKAGLSAVKESRDIYKEMAQQVLDDCNKMLDNPDLSLDDTLKIINQEKEILEMMAKHDQQTFEQEKYYEEKADKKDTEKRNFNWKIVGMASAAIVVVATTTVAALTGGKVDLKLPNNKA